MEHQHLLTFGPPKDNTKNLIKGILSASSEACGSTSYPNLGTLKDRNKFELYLEYTISNIQALKPHRAKFSDLQQINEKEKEVVEEKMVD